MTNSDILQLQKHNAALVKENATLTQDNAELRRQVEAIKQAALRHEKFSSRSVCKICKHRELDGGIEPCVSCGPHMNAQNWQPPDA